MPNLVVLEMVVDLSEAALRVADRVKVAREVRAVMDKAEIRVKRCTMDNLLLSLETPRIQVMDLKGARQRVKNPFIRALENLEILAKASDF